MKQTIFKTSLVNCFVQKFLPSFSLILFVSPYFLSFTSQIVCLYLSLSQSQFSSGLNRQPKNSLDLSRMQESETRQSRLPKLENPEKRQSRLQNPENPGETRKLRSVNPQVVQQVQYLNKKY